jgi:hypothetical protein
MTEGEKLDATNGKPGTYRSGLDVRPEPPCTWLGASQRLPES